MHDNNWLTWRRQTLQLPFYSCDVSYHEYLILRNASSVSLSVSPTCPVPLHCFWGSFCFSIIDMQHNQQLTHFESHCLFLTSARPLTRRKVLKWIRAFSTIIAPTFSVQSIGVTQKLMKTFWNMVPNNIGESVEKGAKGRNSYQAAFTTWPIMKHIGNQICLT